MRDEGADADHLRLEIMHIKQILHDVFNGLEGRAHHNAAAHLIADLLELVETALAVLNRQLGRMQLSVVRGVRGLLPQQIAVRAGTVPGLVACPRPLADGERHRAVRVAALDLPHEGGDPLLGVCGILAALQNEGAEAEAVALVAAVEDLPVRQPVALRVPVVAADAAVEAVVPAVVGKLDEPAQKDGVAVVRGLDRPRGFIQGLGVLRRHRAQQNLKLRGLEDAAFAQLADAILICFHRRTSSKMSCTRSR